MGVGDFDTKAAIIVRDDLAQWQRLNVTAFLISGVIGGAGEVLVGEPYQDADGRRYLPMLRQPVLVFEASAEELRTAHKRALARGLRVATRSSSGQEVTTTIALPSDLCRLLSSISWA
jgi:hypothetical protein